MANGSDENKKPPLKVLEYELDATEFRIFYDFTGPEAQEMAKKYEAQLDSDVNTIIRPYKVYSSIYIYFYWL